jgi:hypothetical protein
MREARMRASMILEQAHDSATEAAAAAHDRLSEDTEEERQELQTEIAYRRAYSDVCRTHLLACMESLTRSIEERERAERGGTRRVPLQRPPRDHGLRPARVTQDGECRHWINGTK